MLKQQIIHFFIGFVHIFRHFYAKFAFWFAKLLCNGFHFFSKFFVSLRNRFFAHFSLFLHKKTEQQAIYFLLFRSKNTKNIVGFYSPVFTNCAIISASITTFPFTYAFPPMWQIPRRIGLSNSIMKIIVSPGSTFCLNFTLSILIK